MARPATITPTLRRAVAQGLARGYTHRAVADDVGIGLRTLDRWLARAAKAEFTKRSTGKLPAAEKPYLELANELVEAEDDADLQALRDLGQYLIGGVDIFAAAHAAKVPPAQLERLRARAEIVSNRRADGDRLDPEQLELLKLVDGFQQALSLAKVQMIGTVQRAGMAGDWHAAAWFLERMFPDEFASPAKRAKGTSRPVGRPIGATSAPDRPSTADEPPPRIRLVDARPR